MKNNLITSIVNKTLNEKYEVREKMRLIIENEEKSDDEKLDDVLNSLADLENQGMSDGEIESNLDEGVVDWLSNYLVPGKDKSSDSEGINKGLGDYGSKISSGLMSQVREWLIGKGLQFVGFKGRLASAIAAGMADLSISTIIGLFRGGNCERYTPEVVDAFAEGLTVYMLEDVDETSAIAKTIRNVGAEYFKASNLGETIAEVICTTSIDGIKKSLEK